MWSGVTMEYAYQDWTWSQMAKALNKMSDHKMLQKELPTSEIFMIHLQGGCGRGH